MAKRDRKLIDFRELEGSIKQYADDHHEGNFSLAVRELLRNKLKENGYIEESSNE